MLYPLIYIFTGLAAGIVIALLTSKSKIDTLNSSLRSMEARLDEASRRECNLQDENQRLSQLSSEFNAKSSALSKEIEMLRQQKAHDEEARTKQYNEQLRLMQEQVKSATQEMLNQRSKELHESNARQMDSIITPLKENIKEMKTAMDQSRDTHTRTTASLRQAIEDIMKRTASIGDEADKLARALRHENKTQGNWGEIVLSELLESQGLKKGIHYDVQSTLRDKNGKPILNERTDKRMIPDVVLHYPDGKDAIIDSKASLSAFIDYNAADDDNERTAALKRHTTSIRNHVKELVAKDYKRYIVHPRQSLDYVIMFVPNESALQLALYNDPSLWRDALREGVFITGEQNLTAALRIIHLAWTQEIQAQSQRKVFEEATTMVERVGEFCKAFEAVGERIDKANEAYEYAMKKLQGRMSILGPARRLKEMGFKEKDKFPIPDLPEIPVDTEDNIS